MDIVTVIRLIVGVIVLLGAILLGGSLSTFIDPVSVIIVVGGTIAAVCIAFPLTNLTVLPKVITKTLFAKSVDINKLIRQLVSFAEIARRDGILSLENHTPEMEDPFIVQGIQMAVDGTDPELIEQIMEQDLENLMIRHERGKALLEGMGKYAPAFGMIGTLIGLVAMLANMEDPANIGAGMAVALLTTLYGAVVANLIFLPMADKLERRNEEEILSKSIIIKGVMSIQAGDNPRVVEQKLSTFLPLSKRSSGEEEEGAARKAA